MSEEIKDVIDNLGTSFEEFKAENQKNIDEIKKMGLLTHYFKKKLIN